ncbi:MAG: Zn-dependent hydrolase of the beta-lactamase fold-like protein [Parcubacteria group bacterium GW2011_GWE2_39_37]|uniref:Zn-dependent hydrolase of the beta-lactamase fold-like protein n=1 Tax=Candidatus Falkowbacteria bacterium GW2011_GWF2_39_8 TaxID=1618642 RepID=A0A0G0PX50_9BACT|nr:MAG: Zn-dependent hydrolase of the beta-lactamase fold-like protein [Parcubacteria group bacterium GW2011_GWE2_39_37]KKR32719.1 MAG: Zn-dependent hydrolase of the beta-lactamase fold-like protein [Candidatus Falkowbacteria bacterium GW2011_GWF2_39_8]
MYITWLGQSCFKMQDKAGSDAVTLITDPFDNSIGLRMPKMEANILTVSHGHKDHNNLESVKGNPYTIDAPGEYEIKDVAIEGVEVFHDDKEGKERGNVVAYRIDMDDITIVHLGDLGHTLNSKQLEVLAGVDILLIPVGGKYTIDAKKAVEVVSQIEPRIVIPMHYKVDGLKEDIDGVEKFIKELGVKPRTEEKLKISKRDLPQDEMELVILNC